MNYILTKKDCIKFSSVMSKLLSKEHEFSDDGEVLIENLRTIFESKIKGLIPEISEILSPFLKDKQGVDRAHLPEKSNGFQISTMTMYNVLSTPVYETKDKELYEEDIKKLIDKHRPQTECIENMTSERVEVSI